MGLKVLVADPVSEEALEPLKSFAQVDIKTGLKPEDLMSVIGDYDAIIVRSQTQVTPDVIKAGKKLQVIARAGVGVDNVNIEEVLSSSDTIMDAFWHYTSNYIIIITEADIKVAELRGGDKRNVVSLYSFDERPMGVYYDEASGSIYFTDLKKGTTFPKSRYLYRTDLKQRFNFFKQIMSRKEIVEKHGER